MKNKKFRIIKREIRILGVDDAPFPPHTKSKVMLIGTIFRGGTWLDGVLRTSIKGDGNDSTANIIKMVNDSRHKDQIGVIMLDGITFGGFNVVSIKKIFDETGIPVIVIMRKFPNFEKIKKALMRFEDCNEKWALIQEAGTVYKIETAEPLYIQIYGIDMNDAKEIIDIATTRSAIPEPIRVAHLIGSGVITGESRGGA